MSTLPSPSLTKNKKNNLSQSVTQVKNTESKLSVKNAKKPPVVAKKPGRTKVAKGKTGSSMKNNWFKNNRKKVAGKKSPKLSWRLAVAGFLGLFFLVGAHYSRTQLKLLVEQIEQKRSHWIALSEMGVNYKKMALDLSQVENEILLISQALPNEAEIIDLFDHLRGIELQTEVVVDVFSFETDQPRLDEAGNNYLDLFIEARGGVENLERFLTNTFNLPILMKAKTINFYQLSQAESRLVFQVRLYVDSAFFVE
ncbi:hypothetical protein ACFL0Y_00590 [Patescibacteria group bacterium]